MRNECEFPFVLGLLYELVCCIVSIKPNENANLLYRLKLRIELVKPTDEEVSDQAVKAACVLLQQNLETVVQGFPILIGQKSEIGR